MRLPAIVSEQEAPTRDTPTVTLKHTSRRVKYARVQGREPGWAGDLCSGKQGGSEEEGWASSQDFQQEHHSEAADTSWASCQLTITCSKTTVESNFPPSDSCQPVLLPTNFASLCTFQKMMALNSTEMGIISFQLINGHFRNAWMMPAHQSLGMWCLPSAEPCPVGWNVALFMNRGRTHSPPYCFQTILSLKSLHSHSWDQTLGGVFCLFFFLILLRSGFGGHKDKTQVHQDQIMYLFREWAQFLFVSLQKAAEALCQPSHVVS